MLLFLLSNLCFNSAVASSKVPTRSRMCSTICAKKCIYTWPCYQLFLASRWCFCIDMTLSWCEAGDSVCTNILPSYGGMKSVWVDLWADRSGHSAVVAIIWPSDVTLAQMSNPLALCAANVYSRQGAKIVGTEIASDPLITNWFALHRAAIDWCDGMKTSEPHIKCDIFIHNTEALHCSCPPHHLHVVIFFPLHLNCPLFPCYVPPRQDSAPLHSLLETLPDSGLPYRHTPEALLKPRLNPTLLCPTLYTSTHS